MRTVEIDRSLFEITPELGRALDRTQRNALIAGAAALILCAIGLFFDPDQFFRAYLVGFMFWLGVTLGCMGLMALHYLSGGGWGLVVRRIFEAASRTFPVLLILFIPVALGIHNLYIWSHADVVANEPLLQHKSAYLNVPFFLVRAAIYFAIWMTLSYFLNKWSLEQDRTGDQALNLRLQLLSGPTLVVYAATVTLAAVDWVMSLDPHWFSTIFGMIFMGGQGISALCFAIAIALMLMREDRPLAGVIKPTYIHDLGKLLLAFVMLWAYFSFSQFLIIWAGNLPEEIPFYVRRLQGGWGAAGLALVVLHFALPFLLLLSRDLKRDARKLVNVAALLVVMRLVDLYWIIAPTVHHDYFFIPWMYVLAPIGLGGIWFAAFIWQLKKRPLLPIGDAHIVEVLPDGRE
jgi:hypothetical protein